MKAPELVLSGKANIPAIDHLTRCRSLRGTVL